MKKITILIAIFAMFISGCCVRSSFTSPQENLVLTIGKTRLVKQSLPSSVLISNTTFGKYPVKAYINEDDVLYFYLPLKVNPVMIVVDAVFFAPAAFFNVQNSLPQYKIDMSDKSVYYKTTDNGDWKRHVISDFEQRRSKYWFEKHSF